MRGKIPPELLQKLKDSVNLIEVIGEHVVLRKTGANHVGLCPFHSERTPSFSVSEGKQLYHCYGCKKSGDLITFTMDIHGIGFPEAIEELAERARIPLPKDWSGPAGGTPEEQKRREEQREKVSLAARLNRFAAAFYHQQLKQVPVAERYFVSRGVDDALARTFYVGAAAPSWDSLSLHLAAKKAPLPLAVELGLIRPSTKQVSSSSGYFDLFRNRAMFPILDMRGRVAGFGGRTLPGGMPGAEEGPKYMNSPESLLFHKSKLAFGLFQAQKHVRETDTLILVEGYFDVVALHAAGFQNVVATCGTSLTPEHLQLFRRFCGRIVILFDGDKAGISATERAMETGLEHGLVLYGAAMPEGLDPDEVLFDQRSGKPLPEGRARMESILSGAGPLLDSRIEGAIREAGEGPEAMTLALKRLAGWLGKYTDPVGREVRVRLVESRLGVSRQLLAQAASAAGGRGAGAGAGSSVAASLGGHPGGARAVGRPGGVPGERPMPGPMPGARGMAPSDGRFSGRPGGAPGASPPGFQARPARAAGTGRAAARLSRFDKALLGALVRGGEFSEIFADSRSKMPPEVTLAELFDYPPAREFARHLFETPGLLDSFRSSPDSALDDSVDPQVRSTIMEAVMAPEAAVSKSELIGAIHRAGGRAWARFSQRIKDRLADAEAKEDAGLQATLMQEYLDVQRKMKEFISFYDEA